MIIEEIITESSLYFKLAFKISFLSAITFSWGKSKLISIDLEDYYLAGERHEIDLKNWLVDELFNTQIDVHN